MIEQTITSRQKRELMELIYQNISDDEKRDDYINQLDDLSSYEASAWIFEFSMAKWE